MSEYSIQDYSKLLSGGLTTFHTQYSSDGRIRNFYLIEQHSKFVTYLTGAQYVHPL